MKKPDILLIYIFNIDHEQHIFITLGVSLSTLNLISSRSSIFRFFFRHKRICRYLLKARICDIFHSRFHCLKLGYTTNKQTSVFRNILGLLGYQIQNLPKKTKFIKLEYFCKNCKN